MNKTAEIIEAIKRLPTKRTLIIHVNHFSDKIEGGYIAQHGKKVGGYMTTNEIGAKLMEESHICVEFLRV